ncbi:MULTISPECIES: haloacid dehalogenase-like hydrolase [unclassified Dysgonomonas]|uniref:HAD family hydrolase n=1 Tax=unclassified Dysgonomonas TaxID=2630389 RepID=UPI0025B86835|nr:MULTISPECIES: haloacid dehalogenase-like hydrolase [unclassified Dysgonomonas]MDR2003349.1 haloacid dehalogenase-like hydrolase [Prevotella sp.]HMM04538.1 haloacid dehalogenase-like hydrolase [Dysgonomonas sp.]
MKKNSFFRKALCLTVVILFTSSFALTAQTYRYIKGWPKEANDRIESFLNSTITMKERKVAIFDCDGTLFGQVPYYLADEALYSYAKKTYGNRTDKEAKDKMAIVDDMLHGKDNVGIAYVQKRVKFFAGLSPEEISNIGNDCYHEKFQGKFYPEMKEFLANLEEYGIEIWVLTASPEYLYQRFVNEQLGIPVDRIIGVKSAVRDGKTTDELVLPTPQDWGKAETIHTFIKARPIIVGGNSRGDMEMMDESVGLKLMVNPDNVKIEKEHAGKMEGMTVKQYWDKDSNAVIVYCNDVPEGNHTYVTQEWGTKANKTNKKQ